MWSSFTDTFRLVLRMLDLRPAIRERGAGGAPLSRGVAAKKSSEIMVPGSALALATMQIFKAY